MVLTVTGLASADAVAEKNKAQRKLMSYRAARVDAIRKLAERINGLVITGETRVKDFVATDDRIEASMVSWLSGMKEVGKPSWTPDGICNLTMEVTIQQVITELKRLHKTYYQGDKIRQMDFDKITTHVKEKTLRETGSGAMPEEFAPRGTSVTPDTGGSDIMSKEAWAYWMAHCTGRGRLMADLAARRDAQRKLGERISGLMITSETSVKDFVASSDEIQTQMATFISGAREGLTTYHDNELIVEKEMTVTLQELVANLQRWHKEYYKGNRIAVQDIQKVRLSTRQKDITETGMGVPPEKYLKDVPAAGVTAIEFAKAEWPPAVQATGQAAIDTDAQNAAQAKLMALRGAELDARRKLSEELGGLMITSSTSVEDFVAMDDRIRTSMLTFQQGGHVVEGSQRVLDDGTVEVIVEIDLDPLENMVLYYQEKLSLRVK
jgi:hypothetical protein